MPTHKTTHLQAPTHKPMLQLAKELFSCQRTTLNNSLTRIAKKGKHYDTKNVLLNFNMNFE